MASKTATRHLRDQGAELFWLAGSRQWPAQNRMPPLFSSSRLKWRVKLEGAASNTRDSGFETVHCRRPSEHRWSGQGCRILILSPKSWETCRWGLRLSHYEGLPHYNRNCDSCRHHAPQPRYPTHGGVWNCPDGDGGVAAARRRCPGSRTRNLLAWPVRLARVTLWGGGGSGRGDGVRGNKRGCVHISSA